MCYLILCFYGISLHVNICVLVSICIYCGFFLSFLFVYVCFNIFCHFKIDFVTLKACFLMIETNGSDMRRWRWGEELRRENHDKNALCEKKISFFFKKKILHIFWGIWNFVLRPGYDGLVLTGRQRHYSSNAIVFHKCSVGKDK